MAVLAATTGAGTAADVAGTLVRMDDDGSSKQKRGHAEQMSVIHESGSGSEEQDAHIDNLLTSKTTPGYERRVGGAAAAATRIAVGAESQNLRIFKKTN